MLQEIKTEMPITVLPGQVGSDGHGFYQQTIDTFLSADHKDIRMQRKRTHTRMEEAATDAKESSKTAFKSDRRVRARYAAKQKRRVAAPAALAHPVYSKARMMAAIQQAASASEKSTPGFDFPKDKTKPKSEDSLDSLLALCQAVSGIQLAERTPEPCFMCQNMLGPDEYEAHILKCLRSLDREEERQLGELSEKKAIELAALDDYNDDDDEDYDGDLSPEAKQAFAVQAQQKQLEKFKSTKNMCPAGRNCHEMTADHLRMYRHPLVQCPLCGDLIELEMSETHLVYACISRTFEDFALMEAERAERCKVDDGEENSDASGNDGVDEMSVPLDCQLSSRAVQTMARLVVGKMQAATKPKYDYSGGGRGPTEAKKAADDNDMSMMNLLSEFTSMGLNEDALRGVLRGAAAEKTAIAAPAHAPSSIMAAAAPVALPDDDILMN